MMSLKAHVSRQTEMGLESSSQQRNSVDGYAPLDSNKYSPHFSCEALLEQNPLPAIVTDFDRKFYGANRSLSKFEKYISINDSHLIFQNRQLRARFIDFSNRIQKSCLKIHSDSEKFSVFEDGSFTALFNLNLVSAIDQDQLIIISLVNFSYDCELDPSLLQKIFGFTPAESRLAALLVNSKSVVECADTLGVRISTIREQLGNLFAKTRTSRQPELIAMLGKLHPLV